MSENLKQSLSALLDDEADEFEVRRTLEQLDAESADTWQRYQLTSAVLKGERPDYRTDLSAGVMTALEAEPALAVKTPKAGLFWKPLASVAVAASVTAMVIFGAQSFEGGRMAPGGATLAGNDQIVLPVPASRSPALLPAQYGAATGRAGESNAVAADVIRLSFGLEHYIDQHHALLRSKAEGWTAAWLPAGFAAVHHKLTPASEVLVYSDGQTAISVTIEPYGNQKSAAGAVQAGDTVALGKRVGDHFVTVVGDVPLMIADRVAGSVQPAGN